MQTFWLSPQWNVLIWPTGDHMGMFCLRPKCPLSNIAMWLCEFKKNILGRILDRIKNCGLLLCANFFIIHTFPFFKAEEWCLAHSEWEHKQITVWRLQHIMYPNLISLTWCVTKSFWSWIQSILHITCIIFVVSFPVTNLSCHFRACYSLPALR